MLKERQSSRGAVGSRRLVDVVGLRRAGHTARLVGAQRAAPLCAALALQLCTVPASSAHAIRATLSALPVPGALLADRRRATLALTLALLLAALAGLLSLGARYMLFGPGSEASALPPLALPGQVVMPRFVFSIDGVQRPLGVAVSPEGDRIYVTESDGERQLKIFDRDGHLLRAVAPPGTGPAGRTPVYLAAHSAGKVYVTDRTRGTVDIYSRDGDYEGELEPPAAIGRPWAPLAIAVSPIDDLAVTEVSKGQHRVLLLGPDASLRLRFGEEGTGLGQFSYPNAIAFDRQGRIFVSDSNNGRVAVFDGGGRPLFSFDRGTTGAFGLPRGLAIEQDKRLYVVDAVGHNVLGFDIGERGARQLLTLGSGGQDNGQFSFPNGLAIDRAGRIYITDRENHRVQVWTN